MDQFKNNYPRKVLIYTLAPNQKAYKILRKYIYFLNH